MTNEMPPALKALVKKITGLDPDDPELDIKVHVVGPDGEGVGDLERLLKTGRPFEAKVSEDRPMLLNSEQLAYFRSALNGMKSATMNAQEGTPELYRQRIIELLATLDYQLAQDRDVGSHLAALTAVLGLSLAILRNLRGMTNDDFERKTAPLMAGVVLRSREVKLPPYSGSRPSFWPDEPATQPEEKE